MAEDQFASPDIDPHCARYPAVLHDQLEGHDPVENLAAVVKESPGENRLELRFFHGQAEFTLRVNLEEFVVAVLVLRKKHAPALDFFHHGPAAFGHSVIDRLVHDSLTGHPIGFHIELRSGLSGNCDNVQCVHPAGDAAAVKDVAFFKDYHLLRGVHFLRTDRRHGAGASSADDQDVPIHVGLSQIHKNLLR